MKNIIKLFLNRLGYKIERKNNIHPFEIKYKKIISEIYAVYQETKFQNLQKIQDKNIDLIANLDGTQPSEAIYLINFLQESIPLQGDICEFGVAQGLTSALLGYQVINTDKVLWLFDSFEGLPKPTEKDLLKDDIFNLGRMESYAGTMAHKDLSVKQKLSDIAFPMSRVNIVKGFIEETIKFKNLPEKVCFAFVDFDFYEPILIALNFLDSVLSVGGYIIVDDYDFFSTGAKLAVDEFLASRQNQYQFILPSQSVGFFCVIKKIN
jgi:hypothetical protein